MCVQSQMLLNSAVDFSTSHFMSKYFGITDYVLLTAATLNDAVNSESRRNMVVSAMQLASLNCELFVISI
jgi:hypothetical protein